MAQSVDLMVLDPSGDEQLLGGQVDTGARMEAGEDTERDCKGEA